MDAKRILVAFDASDNAKRAVEYVGQVLGPCRDAHVTLLYVERLPDRDFYQHDDDWKAACATQAKQVRAALADAASTLSDKGLPAGAVDQRYLSSCRSPLSAAEACSLGTSIARDIVAVQQEGYGTVVIGRRGVSKAEEFLFGSVSTKIMHLAKDCAVWVVS